MQMEFYFFFEKDGVLLLLMFSIDGLTITFYFIFHFLLYRKSNAISQKKNKNLMPRALVMACYVLSSASARASSPAQGTLLAFQCTRRTVINTFYGETRIASICEARIHWCFYEAARI